MLRQQWGKEGEQGGERQRGRRQTERARAVEREHESKGGRQPEKQEEQQGE
jgi:hypothetical protein